MLFAPPQHILGFAQRSLLLVALSLGTTSCLGAEDPDDPAADENVSEVSASLCTTNSYSTAARTQLVGGCTGGCGSIRSCWGTRTSYATTFCTPCR